MKKKTVRTKKLKKRFHRSQTKIESFTKTKNIFNGDMKKWNV